MAGSNYDGFIFEFDLSSGSNIVSKQSYCNHNITDNIRIDNYKSLSLNVKGLELLLGKCDLEIDNVVIHSHNTSLFWFNQSNNTFGFASILVLNSENNFDYKFEVKKLYAIAKNFLDSQQDFYEIFYVKNEDGSFNNKKTDYVSTEEEEAEKFKAYTKLYKTIYRAIDFIEEHLNK